MSETYPFTRPGVLISQPFGEFFVTSIPAKVLLDVAYSDRVKAVKQNDDTYVLDGSQRNLDDKRLKEIGQFINTPTDAAFPNSIVLAANYKESTGLIEEDENLKWKLDAESPDLVATLAIPTDTKLAAIIDGQHRLFGFRYASKQNLSMPLLCAIFFDLPKPYQAFLFATINANQRPVNKSLTYELFGYNIAEEPPAKWTPEKFAVFITRRLGADKDSPFFQHITVAAENDFAPRLAEVRREHGWAVSTATVVEGILKLISRNPKTDAATMGGHLSYEGNSRTALRDTNDSSPLRALYVEKADDIIYATVRNYFTAVNDVLWKNAVPDSLIRKTVGVQALFDLARTLMVETVTKKDSRTAEFEKRLSPAHRVDFSDSFFQTSGTGRQRIRTSLEISLGIKKLADVNKHQEQYARLLAG